MKNILLIAAAGMGTRMKSVVPKCLIEIEGVPNLIRWLEVIPRSDFEIILVVGHQSDKILSRISTYMHELHIVENKEFARTSALDSYKLGIKKFLMSHIPLEHPEILDKPAMIICADLVMSKFDMQKIFDAKSEEFCGISSISTSNATSVDLSGDTKYVIQISERHDKNSCNFWGNYGNIRAKTILETEGSFLRDVARAKLPMKTIITKSTDYDTPDDLEVARELIRSLEKSNRKTKK